MKKQFLAVLAQTSIGAIAIATAMPAFAHAADETATTAAVALPQDKAPAGQAKPDDQKKDTDIVVTGSQIRNVTPAGATILTQTRAQAEEQGAANANDILANLPQAANVFQNLPSVGGGGSVGGTIAASRLSFSAISLRNLPNVNTGAGEFTLQLMDGHRIVPIGSDVLGGMGVDPSMIPASTLQQTEIMPDGGSAIYGSNAVAGVINYITRDDFDGIELQARGGIAGSYKQLDTSVTAGTKWNSGSVWGSVTYSAHDALFGRDRAWIHAIDANPNSPLFGTPLGLNCFNPNIAITTTVSGASSRRLYPETAPGGTIQPYTTNGGTNGNGTTANGIAGGNRCDSTDNTAIYPKSWAVNAAFGLKQDITDGLTFSVKGNYAHRKTTSYQALTLTAAMTAATPGYRPVCNEPVVPPAVQPAGAICGVTPGFFAGDSNKTQSVLTDYSSVLPTATNAFITIDSWQVTPGLTWNFAKDWQVRAIVSYGESKDAGITGGVDTNVQTARITAGLINPYNLPASGAGAFSNLITYDYRAATFHLLDARVVADGPLPFIKAPGGDIKVAIGAEYFKDTGRNLITGSVLSPTPNNFVIGTDISYTQIVKSVFGEANIPLISESNDIPLISSLTFQGSARYDYYNDVKGTFNWMAGGTWAPVPWVKFRANYNTSFAAPNILAEIAILTGANFSNSTNNQAGAALPFFQGFIPPGNVTGANTGGTAGTCTPASACFAIPNAAGGGLNIGITAAPSNGTVPGIGPQTSRTWSVGGEFNPPFLPGLSLGASYYDLKISNAIASPFVPNAQSEFDFHPELITCHGGVKGSDANAKTACAQPMTVAELISLGWLVAANPLNPAAGGLSTAASIGPASPGGAFGTTPWPTIIAQYCGTASDPAGAVGSCHAIAGTNGNTYTVYAVADNRSRNLGFIFSTGIDFRAAYRTNVPWGSIDLGVTGTVNLSTMSQASAFVAAVDNQAFGFSKWRMTANAGTTWGGLRAQVTWQHSAGYLLAANVIGTVGTATIPGSGAYGQTSVSAYDTFDLFFRYDFNKGGMDSGIFKDLSVTLNVNNFLDIDPPIQGGGYANGTTLGRMWQLGITKRFR